MADEDKEKAEKLAAAKKRFEQLKKEQQKKAKKGGKKKADKAEAEASTEDAGDAVNENAGEGAGEVAGEDVTEVADEPAADATDNKESAADGDAEPDATADKDDAERPSVTQESKQRSESFRQDLYRQQTSKIEELEKENKLLQERTDHGTASLAKAEQELERLREDSSELVILRTKAEDAEKLSIELAAVQRQLTQAQQQAAKGAARRVSVASPDFSAQLASQSSTIESLELDVSNLRNQLSQLETAVSVRDAAAKDLETRATTAETAEAAAKQELDALRVSISFPSDETKAANEDPEALTKRITVLESDVRTANSNLAAAADRATGLEEKIAALTKLHREATTAAQAKDRELEDLRSQLQKRNKPSHVRDASEFELDDEETETGQLQARIRALEAENFDLRRGVWRDKRAAMQPGMDDYEAHGLSPGYEDVDLSAGAHSPRSRAGSGYMAVKRQTSTFQDVIASGINAFAGRPPQHSHHSATQLHERKQSLGLLSEDEGFDEDAFRLAQEEEAKRRIERVKEVKRGLDQWRGWRVDLAEARRNAAAAAVGAVTPPVFEL